MSGAITATAVAVGLTATELVTAVAITGAVVGAVGAVTGIKPLQYAGMALGVVGGLGGLAISAGFIGADALATGAAIADPASAGLEAAAASINPDIEGVAAQAAAGLGGQSLSGVADVAAATPAIDTTGNLVDLAGNVSNPGTAAVTGTGATDATNPLQAVATNAGSPSVTPTAATDSGVTIPQGDGGDFNAASDAGRFAQQPGNPANTGSPPVPTATPPASPGNPGPVVDPAASAPVTGAPQVSAQAAADPLGNNALLNGEGSEPSIWSKIGDIVTTKGGGTLASGVIQAGASFLAGATNGLTPAQIQALQAQAAMNQAAANLSRLQQSNMGANIPIASRTPAVTGAPVGLINSAPRTSVTGAPT